MHQENLGKPGISAENQIGISAENQLFLYLFLLGCWPNGLPFQPCLQACPASCMAPAPDVPAAPATRCGARAEKFRHRDAFAFGEFLDCELDG